MLTCGALPQHSEDTADSATSQGFYYGNYYDASSTIKGRVPVSVSMKRMHLWAGTPGSQLECHLLRVLLSHHPQEVQSQLSPGD